MKTLKTLLVVILTIILAASITSCFISPKNTSNTDSSTQKTEPPTNTKEIIDITVADVKTKFKFGEEFSYEDIFVTATMTDNSQKVLSDSKYTVSCEDFNPMRAGTYTVTVQVTDSNVSKTYDVTVSPADRLKVLMIGNSFADDTINYAYEIAKSVGIPEENILISSNGNVIELTQNSIKASETVTAGRVLVDGLGVGDVGSIVLRDRKTLSNDGIIVVAVSVDSVTREIVAGPDVVSRGFVYVKESDELMEEARDVVDAAVNSLIDRGISDWGKLKTTTKDALGDYVWKKTKRRPMILPIIMEV
jgi:hypothetical protein